MSSDWYSCHLCDVDIFLYILNLAIAVKILRKASSILWLVLLIEIVLMRHYTMIMKQLKLVRCAYLWCDFVAMLFPIAVKYRGTSNFVVRKRKLKATIYLLHLKKRRKVPWLSCIIHVVMYSLGVLYFSSTLFSLFQIICVLLHVLNWEFILNGS